jgi:hypothetical protein
MPVLRDKQRRNQLRAELYNTLESSGGDIAETIKTLRRILAKDQSEFSKMTGVGLATLRKIEQNNGNITMATLEKILSKFSLTIVVTTKSTVTK